MKKSKMSARMLVLGGAVVVLAFAGVYAYNNYVVGLGKSDASEGDPSGTPARLSCSPSSSTVPIGASVVFTAKGGGIPPQDQRSTYSWSSPEGDPSTGLGQTFRTAYYFRSLGPRTFTVTVRYGSQTAKCSVIVGMNTPTPGNGLTAAKYSGYANQSIVVPRTSFKIGHYTLATGALEGVTVDTIGLSVNGTGTFTAAKLLNVYLKVYNDVGTLIYTSIPKSTVSGTAVNNYAVTFSIPQNKTYQVEVLSDIGQNITSGHAMTTSLGATGVLATSGGITTAPSVSGQTITSVTGSLNISNAPSMASRLVAGGSLINNAYAFTLQPQYSDYTLKGLVLKLANTSIPSQGAVAAVSLWDGTTQIGVSPIINGTATFLGLNLVILESGGTKTLTVKIQTSNVGPGANETGGNVKIGLASITYVDQNGSITTLPIDTPTHSGSNFYVHKSYPTFTNLALPSTILAPGEKTLFKTQLRDLAYGVAWRRIVFTTSVTSHPTISNFKLFENGADISSLGVITVGGHNFSVAGAGTGTVTVGFGTDRLVPANSSVTLELRGSVGGSNVPGDSIQTKIANPTGATPSAPTNYVSVANTRSSFIWSDLSSAGHSATTLDWMGDGLVQTLDESQSLYQ